MISSPTAMTISGLAFEVSHRVPFQPTSFSKVDEVKEAFNFAWKMTFGKSGEHRDHRTGGVARRKNGEIFANTFQGKLAEFAVCQELSSREIHAAPDLSVMGLGQWDSFDLKVGGYVISVKSTKRFGNLLLLEAADWDDDGNYLHNEGEAQTDLTALVRIAPSPEDLLREKRLLYSSTCKLNELKWAVAPIDQYKFQVVGAVTREFITSAVRNKLFLPRGATLNRRTTIDADNYYVQACDFRPLTGLLE